MKRERNNMDSDCACLPLPTKKEGEENIVEDFFQKLPDEILVKILSFLTIKEAVSTSILSSRWRYLWTFFTGCLAFYYPSKRTQFAECVKKVLGSLKGPTVEEFKIRLSSFDDCDVDDWITFALAKRVQKIEIDLSGFRAYCCCQHDRYRKLGAYHAPLDFYSHSNFSSLTSLRLRYFDVTNENLEQIISCSPFLEVLSVMNTKCLTSLRISGPSLKLRHLQFRACSRLKYLQINARNLISFYYEGSKANVSYRNVTSLSEICFGGCYLCHIMRDLHLFSSLLVQLQTLKLNLYSITVPKAVLQKIPALPSLKRMELTIDVNDGNCLLPCVAFLKASPSIYEFTLKLSYVAYSTGLGWNLKNHPYLSVEDLNLRVFELIGFVGLANDVEFVASLIDTATQLEKITIDPCRLFEGSKEESFRKTRLYQHYRNRAIDLRAKFPHLDIVIP